jgi:hypothetical protein
LLCRLIHTEQAIFCLFSNQGIDLSRKKLRTKKGAGSSHSLALRKGPSREIKPTGFLKSRCPKVTIQEAVSIGRTYPQKKCKKAARRSAAAAFHEGLQLENIKIEKKMPGLDRYSSCRMEAVCKLHRWTKRRIWSIEFKSYLYHNGDRKKMIDQMPRKAESTAVVDGWFHSNGGITTMNSSGGQEK